MLEALVVASGEGATRAVRGPEALVVASDGGATRVGDVPSEAEFTKRADIVRRFRPLRFRRWSLLDTRP